MLDLLKSLNINVLDASKDEKEIKEAFNELYQDLILQPGGQDRIFAFTKLATQQGQFLGQVVLNQHYNTVNLYEEAGHLLVYYLEALSKINPAIGQELGIDYLWKKPSDPNATDYLAQTEEYKVHYQKTFEQMMARLSHQKNTIEEYARILSTDPNYFGDNTTLVNSLIQKYLGQTGPLSHLNISGINVQNPTTKRLIIQERAETLARIEIAGRIMGKALHTAAKGEPVKQVSKNPFAKYVWDNLVRVANWIMDGLVRVVSRRSTLLKKLQAHADTLPMDTYSVALRNLAKDIWQNRANAVNYFRPNPRIELAEASQHFTVGAHYLETYSVEELKELDKVLSKVDENLAEQIATQEELLVNYSQSQNSRDRITEMQRVHNNEGSVTLEGVKHVLPLELFNYIFTMEPTLQQKLFSEAQQAYDNHIASL